MKHCLIVDDSRVVRTVAGRIVKDLSFEVSEAGDGAQALRQCRERMPDAILLDWNMPVMNGIDFLRALLCVDPIEFVKHCRSSMRVTPRRMNTS